MHVHIIFGGFLTLYECKKIEIKIAAKLRLYISI